MSETAKKPSAARKTAAPGQPKAARKKAAPAQAPAAASEGGFSGLRGSIKGGLR
jgi:hypothetical protein